MDSLITLDYWLFEIINIQMSSPFLDVFFHPLSNKWLIRFAVVFFMFMFFSLGTPRLRWVIVLCGAALLTTDMTVVILKEVFSRVRPCESFEGAIVMAGCSDSYGFPSRHTADIFSMAVFLSAIYSSRSIWFMSIAVYLGFSRIYLGMHYPFDVMAGIFVGSVIGVLFLWVDNAYYEKVKARYNIQ